MGELALVDPAPLPAQTYRDSTGALKREVAQFRIYGYDGAGRVVLSHLDKSMDYRTLCDEVPDFVTVGYDGLEMVA